MIKLHDTKLHGELVTMWCFFRTRSRSARVSSWQGYTLPLWGTWTAMIKRLQVWPSSLIQHTRSPSDFRPERKKFLPIPAWQQNTHAGGLVIREPSFAFPWTFSENDWRWCCEHRTFDLKARLIESQFCNCQHIVTKGSAVLKHVEGDVFFEKSLCLFTLFVLLCMTLRSPCLHYILKKYRSHKEKVHLPGGMNVNVKILSQRDSVVVNHPPVHVKYCLFFELPRTTLFKKWRNHSLGLKRKPGNTLFWFYLSVCCK